MRRSRLSRREVLHGFGGALIALPLLDAHRVVRAAGAPATAKRFMAFGFWDGVIPELWFPSESSETGFTLKPMLEPLAKHRANLIIMKGVDNRVAMESKARNGHAEGVSSFLTGWAPIEMPLKSNNWFPPSGVSSVDQVIAKELEKRGVLTKYSSVNFQGGGSYDTLAWVNGQSVPGAKGLSAALASTPMQSDEAIAKAKALRKSILDGALGSYQRLAGKVSGEDRNRINAHLESLRDLEKRIDLTGASAACGKMPAPLMSMYDNEKSMRANLDLAIAAFSCDLTRSITLNWQHAGGGGPQLPWIDVQTDMHELSHQVVSAKATTSRDAFVKVRRWFNEQLAYVVDRMKAIQLPDGSTLFDETVLFPGTELSFDHNQPDMPYLILAGDRTPFRTGRYVQVAPKVPHNNLLVTMLHAFGIDATSFGNPAYSSGNLDAQFLKG